MSGFVGAHAAVCADAGAVSTKPITSAIATRRMSAW
jgi:hypothetical protein